MLLFFRTRQHSAERRQQSTKLNKMDMDHDNQVQIVSHNSIHFPGVNRTSSLSIRFVNRLHILVVTCNINSFVAKPFLTTDVFRFSPRREPPSHGVPALISRPSLLEFNSNNAECPTVVNTS